MIQSYDALVVGGGIAGLQTALDLADRGRKVLDQPLTELTGGGTSLEEVFTRVMTRDEATEPDAEGEAA